MRGDSLFFEASPGSWLSPLDGTAQRSPKRCLGVEIVSASCTGDKGMPVGRCMSADSTIAAHCSHMAAWGAPFTGRLGHNVALKIEMEGVPQFLFRSYVSHTDFFQGPL